MEMRRSVLAGLITGALLLAGCSSGNQDQGQSQPLSEAQGQELGADPADITASDLTEAEQAGMTEDCYKQIGEYYEELDGNWDLIRVYEFTEIARDRSPAGRNDPEPLDWAHEKLQRSLDKCYPQDNRSTRQVVDDTIDALVEYEEFLPETGYSYPILYVGSSVGPFSKAEREEIDLEYGDEELKRYADRHGIGRDMRTEASDYLRFAYSYASTDPFKYDGTCIGALTSRHHPQHGHLESLISEDIPVEGMREYIISDHERYFEIRDEICESTT